MFALHPEPATVDGSVIDSILFVTDDWDLSLATSRAFKSSGFTLQCEGDVARGVKCAVAGVHQAVLLDAMPAPGIDILQLVRHIRSRSVVPLIVVSKGTRGGLTAILEAGADDYVPPPLEPAEIVARVRAVLRRGVRLAARQPIEIPGIRIEPTARVAFAGGRALELTSIEFDLLEYLVREAGRPVSREELMAAVYGREMSPLDRALDVHVSHLRRKLNEHGRLIVTIRGTGYMCVVPVNTS